MTHPQKRFLYTTLLLLLSMLSLPIFSFAETSHLLGPQKSPGSFSDNLFVKAQHLQCGRTDVVITTTCVQREEGLAYCFNQNISFLKKDGDIIRNVNYNAPFESSGGGYQPLITKIFCVPMKNKFYLDVGSTIFESCSNCEWSDYFSENGTYLGSTSGHYPRTNFKYRIASKSFLDAILTVENTDLKSVFISRVNEEKEGVVMKDPNE